jgi:hypothetical protein
MSGGELRDFCDAVARARKTGTRASHAGAPRSARVESGTLEEFPFLKVCSGPYRPLCTPSRSGACPRRDETFRPKNARARARLANSWKYRTGAMGLLRKLRLDGVLRSSALPRSYTYKRRQTEIGFLRVLSRLP